VLVSWRGFGNTLGRTKWFGQGSEGQGRRRVVHDELVEGRKKASREEVKYSAVSTTTITTSVLCTTPLGSPPQDCKHLSAKY
jgi:hypothetical protein